jgi:hypothetical protein
MNWVDVTNQSISIFGTIWLTVAGSFGFIEISAGLYRATEMQGLWFGILRDAIQAIHLATSFLQRRSMQHFFDQVTGNIFA